MDVVDDAAGELAQVLIDNGLQRMTARVLVALLFAERETVTAGEIADRLGVSAGSVSTAIKSLSTLGLVERAPVPGSRREHYRCPDEAWARLMSNQNAVIETMMRAARSAVDIVGADSVAGHRLATMHSFYAHLMRELPEVIERWRRDVRR